MAIFRGTAAAEQIIGGAEDDQIYGLAGNDRLSGLAGNDLLDGGAGEDTLIGGMGDDIYIVDLPEDRVVESAGEGHDLVRASVSYELGADVEDLVLVGNAAFIFGFGNALDNLIVGSSGHDIISGGAGDDTLIGNFGNDDLSGQAGADFMRGGFGDDTYDVDSVGDWVGELADEGIDTVISTITYRLGANVENLDLQGWESINGSGNALDNKINGNTLANVLNGGAGDDLLIGLRGDDVYDVDSTGDRVVEAANEGYDRIRSLVSYTLGANVEELDLGGTADLNGTGNALANRIVGNAGANLLDGGAGVDVLIGGGGGDIYVVDAAGDQVVEAGGQGTDLVRAWASYALAGNVEILMLMGSGNIGGTGNAQGNTIFGNAGANALDGGAGDDVLIGGAGNDTYYVGSANDQVVETTGGGADRVFASVSHALGANVEGLTLTGLANLGGTGNALDNTITGNAGANVLDGGGGNDVLMGRAGNDVYLVDSAGDRIVEAAGEGLDQVQSSVSHRLGANIEILILTGSADLYGVGNDQANTITGNAGANVLNGGAGDDVLIGGAGDDIYEVDSTRDRVVEAAGEGDDRLRVSASYALGANIETLILTGAADINGLGNALDNTIVGTTGANVLNGGAGNDVLIGGAGNDVYDVGSAGDQAVERADEGYDRVRASVSFTLGANVEELDLTGINDINGFGNALDNTIVGNTENNVLNGGAGDDLLVGRAGDDVYDVDTAGDIVQEAAGEGYDRVRASINYTLGSNVEALGLTGMAALDGTGNGQDNTIVGNAGANLLKGGGGNDTLEGAGGADQLEGEAGRDTLRGGDGNDILYGGAGADTLDGGAGNDTIDIQIDDLATGESYNGGAGKDELFIYLDVPGVQDFSHISVSGIETFIAGYVIFTAAQIGQFKDIVVFDLTIAGSGTVNFSGVESMVAERIFLSDEGNTLILPVAVDGASVPVYGGAGDDVIVAPGNHGNLFGGGGDDTLTGGAQQDWLDGGLGHDRMTGAGGNDHYEVDSAADRIIELAGGGIDEVFSAVSFTLSDNVENLLLAGEEAINATGNAEANVLKGNDAANTINGGAGNDSLIGNGGDDVLVGGAGGDLFYIQDLGLDTIVDFSSAQGDKFVHFGLRAFTYVGAEAFTAGGHAEARFAGGQLLIDTDGNGSAEITVNLAGITSASQLHASDFAFS
jgi:Ca2+-binding RTX toxin-like protein